MHKFPAIVVPFCKGINARASTFRKACEKGAFLLAFQVFCVMRGSGATFFARRKNILLPRSYYVFWNKCGDFMNLFGMAKLVGGDEFEPSVEIEHAEEGMREAIGREISRFCFVEERESSFANSAESGKHGVFFGEERGVDGKRRLEAADAIFGQEKRESKAIQKGNWARGMAKDAIRVGDDAGFDLAEMSDDFGGGPGGWGGRSLPKIKRDGVGGSEEAGLGAEEFRAERVEPWHLRSTTEEDLRLTQMLRRRIEAKKPLPRRTQPKGYATRRRRRPARRRGLVGGRGLRRTRGQRFGGRRGGFPGAFCRRG